MCFERLAKGRLQTDRHAELSSSFKIVEAHRYLESDAQIGKIAASVQTKLRTSGNSFRTFNLGKDLASPTGFEPVLPP